MAAYGRTEREIMEIRLTLCDRMEGAGGENRNITIQTCSLETSSCRGWVTRFTTMEEARKAAKLIEISRRSLLVGRPDSCGIILCRDVTSVLNRSKICAARRIMILG